MAMQFAAIDFISTKAYQKLEALSRDAYDLTAPGALNPERVASLRAGSCGFDLLYATQRVTGEVMAALESLAEETGAREQFQSLMAGETMNRIEGHESENRQVLHFAGRNVFDGLPDPFDGS